MSTTYPGFHGVVVTSRRLAPGRGGTGRADRPRGTAASYSSGLRSPRPRWILRLYHRYRRGKVAVSASSRLRHEFRYTNSTLRVGQKLLHQGLVTVPCGPN